MAKRGRPRGKSDRQSKIIIYLKPFEKTLIQQDAKKEGFSDTEYCRRAILMQIPNKSPEVK